MLRQKLMAHHRDDGFRWRGAEVTRIEGLSDAVFAFAVTLLVVSLEVPKTFDELLVVMRGFFAFAVCFALLLQVWHEQYRFFRRYNLQDSASLFLNCILLFLVLFYVYPLKFLFTLLINGWLGWPAGIQIKPRQLPQLMEIFSGGYLAVACVFILLFSHALRKREALELNDFEVFDTKVSIGAAGLNAFTALVSLAIAGFAPLALSGFSGMIYPILLGPSFGIYYNVMGRRRRRLAASPTPA
ncbi:MAG TPA: TMEM175 family protein [Candidatus Acidoferrales bacterium]|nr:TMEM175 family protein [Candidatus Acidoferrales bacterium]